MPSSDISRRILQGSIARTVWNAALLVPSRKSVERRLASYAAVFESACCHLLCFIYIPKIDKNIAVHQGL